MATLIKRVSGWGRYPVQSCEMERPERYADLKPASPTLIARGQGRSYGDAALSENGHVILTERVNRLLSFDVENGILRAESGVTLGEILNAIVPKGWFLPVTPGTKHVSLGGCVAADVHGKNHHHDGGFGNHVLSIELIKADGSRIVCSPENHSDVFWATVGGMGLTGIIGEVTIKLIHIHSAKMMVRHYKTPNLEQIFKLLENPTADDSYTVAWIDSLAIGRELGRGVVMCGHHANDDELPFRIENRYNIKTRRAHSIPFNFPAFALNTFSISKFNAFYYRHEGKKTRPYLTDYDPYFYPLDGLNNWNRMYGKQGFVQYQCVIPDKTSFEGIKAILETLTNSRHPSFLAVLKRLGAESKGMLSFAMPGYTLALDLPIRDQGLFALLNRLDQIVMQHGGRVYLAKDARLSPESFHTMYPRYEEWLNVKTLIDPENRFRSSLSQRLKIGETA